MHAAAGPFSEEMIARTIGQCCLTHGLGEDFEVIAIHAQAWISPDAFASLLQAIPELSEMAAYDTSAR